MKLNLQGPSGIVCSMTFKGEMLFAGTGDGRIMAWQFPANESNLGPVAILSGHERQVISLSITATRLYSASLDRTSEYENAADLFICLWLVNIMFVLINSGYLSGIWDLATLQCVQTLSEHKAAVTSVLCWDQKLLSCSLCWDQKLLSCSCLGLMVALMFG